jgi:hypothetical protein
VLKLYSPAPVETFDEVNDMIWSEHPGTSRGLATILWLGPVAIIWAWRLGRTTITGFARHRANRRLGRVSRAWLDEYETSCAKHGDPD